MLSKAMVNLFFVLLLISEMAQIEMAPSFSIKDAKEWFEANYDPQFSYSEDGSFAQVPGCELSPFHIVPRWEEAKLVSQHRNKSESRWEVPVIEERRVNMRYRQKGKRLEEQTTVKPRRMDFCLVVCAGRKGINAFVQAECRAPESEEDRFTGVRVEMDINTGAILNLTYLEKGKLILCRSYDGGQGVSGGHIYYQDGILSYARPHGSPLPPSFSYMDYARLDYARPPQGMVKMNAKLSSFHHRASTSPIEVRYSASANPDFPKL